MPTWPPGFQRIPDDPWTRDEVTGFAVGYDRLADHGWYCNLDPTVAAIAAWARDGHVVVDYSGGTGLLIDRLLPAIGDRDVGVIDVDASAKFLRLGLRKHRDDARVAFRHLPYLPEQVRLLGIDEALGPGSIGGVDGLACANAVHLYPDLVETFQAWHTVLRPDAPVWIQSGNIQRAGRPDDHWVIDGTVHAIAEEAKRLVAEEPKWIGYIDALADEACMAAHEALRHRYFLPVRELQHYVDALELSGFEVEAVAQQAVPVVLGEWMEFLSVYHEGIVGWIGGCRKVEGNEPTAKALADRQVVLREAARRVFRGEDRFTAEWNHITARRV